MNFQTASKVYGRSRLQRRSALSPIRLILQTSKKRYRLSESIRITAFLENISDDKYFYVGRDISDLFGSNSLHYIGLSFKDAAGKEVPIGRGAGDGVWEYGTTIREKLERAYIQLNPGMFYGLKEEVELPFLKPGRYRLQATYYEIEAGNWNEAERKSLLFPVWTQEISSNVVMIDITPNGRNKR